MPRIPIGSTTGKSWRLHTKSTSTTIRPQHKYFRNRPSTLVRCIWCYPLAHLQARCSDQGLLGYEIYNSKMGSFSYFSLWISPYYIVLHHFHRISFVSSVHNKWGICRNGITLGIISLFCKHRKIKREILRGVKHGLPVDCMAFVMRTISSILGR